MLRLLSIIRPKGYDELLSEPNGVFKERVDIVSTFTDKLSNEAFANMIDLYSERWLSVSDPQDKDSNRMQAICKIADEYANTEWPVTKIITKLSESLQGYEGRGRSLNSDFFKGPESTNIGTELSSSLSNRVLGEEANQNFYYKVQNISSQALTASPDNHMFFEYLLDQVALLRNNIIAAGSWSTTVETGLAGLENMISEKLQALAPEEKDPKTKLIDYIDYVAEEDTYRSDKDPLEMSMKELVNAFIDKISYEIATYGSVNRASEVITDKKAVATIIGTLNGKDQSVILDTVKDVIKEEYKGSSINIDNGLSTLKAFLPNLKLQTQRLVTPVETSEVKGPQSISEALKLSSNREELIEEYPAVFTYQNMLEFVASAESLPKAKALNVLTQATNITKLLALPATEAEGLKENIANMTTKITTKDKDLLVERILEFYNKRLLMVGDVSSKNAVIEGFKDYLLIHDVSLKNDADLCKIVSGTAEREEADSLMAFRGKAQKDGALFLLLLANNPTIVFNGAVVQMSDFLANNISNKEVMSSYLVEQAKATPEGDLVVNRNGADQIIKVTGAVKEKAYLLLQEAEPTLMLEE